MLYIYNFISGWLKQNIIQLVISNMLKVGKDRINKQTRKCFFREAG